MFSCKWAWDWRTTSEHCHGPLPAHLCAYKSVSKTTTKNWSCISVRIILCTFLIFLLVHLELAGQEANSQHCHAPLPAHDHTVLCPNLIGSDDIGWICHASLLACHHGCTLLPGLRNVCLFRKGKTGRQILSTVYQYNHQHGSLTLPVEGYPQKVPISIKVSHSVLTQPLSIHSATQTFST